MSRWVGLALAAALTAGVAAPAGVSAAPSDPAPTSIPQVSVTKTVTPSGTVAPGSQLTYTIQVVNTSTAGELLNNVVITDPLPANVTFASSPDGGIFSAGNVIWNLGNVTAGGVVARSFTATVNAGTATGTTISNTASVSATNLAVPQPSNAAVTSVGAGGTGSLTTAKTVSPTGNVSTGQILTYTVVTTNNSGVTVNNVTVTDPVPAGTTYQSGGTLSGSNVVFTTPTLTPGQSATNQFTVLVTSATQGQTISNAAQVTATGLAAQTTNTVVNTIGTGSAQLTATLTNTPTGSVGIGQGIVYTLTLTNGTAQQITNVTVTVPVPSGTTYLNGSGGTFNAGTNQVVFTIPVMTPGQSITSSFGVTLTAGALGAVVSTAAQISSAQTGTTTSNTVSNTIGSGTTTGAGLTLTKSGTAIAGGLNPGQPVSFTVTYANNGSTTLNNVVISDNLPIGLTWVPGSGGQPTGTGQTIIFPVSLLTPGQTGSVSFQATINPGTPIGTQITNTAQATANEVGGITSNNVIITVGGTITNGGTSTGGGTTNGPLTVLKTASPPTGSTVQPGGTIQYQIQVTNNSASPVSGLTVTDAAPVGTVLLPTGIVGGTVNGTTATWNQATLLAGQSATFSFGVQVYGGTGVLPGQPGYLPGQPGYLPGYPSTSLPGYPTTGYGTTSIVNTAQVSAAGVSQFASNQTTHTVYGVGQPGYPVPGQPGYPVPGQPGYPVPGQPGVIGGIPGGIPSGNPYGGAEGFIGGVPGAPGNPLQPLGAGAPAPAPAPAAPSVSRSESGSYNAIGSLAPTVFLPFVANGQNGMTSAITIFNASPQPNQVGIQFVGVDAAPGPRDQVNLPPNGSVTYTNVPGGFVGAAVLTGQTPIAAEVTVLRQGADDMSYEGIPAATGQNAGTVYLPLLFRRYTGWSSDIAVQNAGQAPAEVTLVYRSSDPAAQGVAATETATIGPGSIHIFSQNNTPGLADNFVGGAVLTSTSAQPLAAVVNLSNSGTPAAMSYTGVYASQAAASIRAPLLMKGHNGWDTGLQVQNVGSAPTSVRVDYTASGGGGIAGTDTATLAPGESRTFFTPAASGLPGDFVGSAVVTSDNGQPLAAVVNQTKYALGTAMTYSALATGASTVVAPVAFKASQDGYNSGVQVQNLGTSPAQVTVQFFTEQGQPAGSLQDTIAANGSSTYYLPNVGQIGPGFRGSVVVTSANGQPLGAIVNDVAYR